MLTAILIVLAIVVAIIAAARFVGWLITHWGK